MRKTHAHLHLSVCLLVLVFVLVASSRDGRAQTQQPLARRPDVAAAIDVLDAWIQSTAAIRDEPGLSIGVVYDQDLIWTKGYGWQDRDKRIAASPNTLYRIASISKLFTTTGVLQLRDAGKLQLDDPVAKHLSWFRMKGTTAGVPAVTIRHLLTHTCGLPRELPLFYWNDLKFPTRETMIALLPTEETVFPPETKYKYSNLAFALAGEVVQAASGEPYKQYIEQHILKPLSLTSTLVEPTASTPHLAVGYRKRVPGAAREVEDFIDCGALTPAASFASNVVDLAKLISLQFRDSQAGGSQILKGSTLHEMRRVQWLQPDWQAGQGLGWSIRRVDQQVRIAKDAAAPGYKSHIELAPAEKFGVVVLMNGYDSDPQYYVNQAFAIVGRAVAKATTAVKTSATADPAWSKFVGTYTWKHVDTQVMVLDGELTMIVPDAANPWDSRVRLTPIGPRTFRMIGGPNDGELLTFDVDDTGRATKLTASSYFRVRKQAAPPNQ